MLRLVAYATFGDLLMEIVKPFHFNRLIYKEFMSL
jgi:hypothetical protein